MSEKQTIKYIFVDESRISQARYQLFGSLWLPREKQGSFRDGFWRLWDNEFPSRKSELKWTKVSKGKLNVYKKFIDYFATFPQVDFRCVVLDTRALDYQKHHEGDEELGFYKFLYFFLSRNIEKDYRFKKVENVYQVFIDSRRQSDKIEVGRLGDLKRCLNQWLIQKCSPECWDYKGWAPPLPIRNVEATVSHLSPEVQLVDVLTGAVGYAWEGFQTSPAKLGLIKHIENIFGLSLAESTPYLTEKINIWLFRLKEQQKSALSPTPPKGSGIH